METGGRVSYGLKLSHFFNKDGIFSGMIGQSYKFRILISLTKDQVSKKNYQIF